MKHFGQFKTSKLQDGSCSPNAITWDFVWVNQYIALNVLTNF